MQKKNVKKNGGPEKKAEPTKERFPGELEIKRKEAEWRKWQDYWRTYQRVIHYSIERDAAVQALEGEGRIVDPLPNLEWIRDGVEAQVAGRGGVTYRTCRGATATRPGSVFYQQEDRQ